MSVKITNKHGVNLNGTVFVNTASLSATITTPITTQHFLYENNTVKFDTTNLVPLTSGVYTINDGVETTSFSSLPVYTLGIYSATTTNISATFQNNFVQPPSGVSGIIYFGNHPDPNGLVTTPDDIRVIGTRMPSGTGYNEIYNTMFNFLIDDPRHLLPAFSILEIPNSKSWGDQTIVARLTGLGYNNTYETNLNPTMDNFTLNAGSLVNFSETLGYNSGICSFSLSCSGSEMGYAYTPSATLYIYYLDTSSIPITTKYIARFNDGNNYIENTLDLNDIPAHCFNTIPVPENIKKIFPGRLIDNNYGVTALKYDRQNDRICRFFFAREDVINIYYSKTDPNTLTRIVNDADHSSGLYYYTGTGGDVYSGVQNYYNRLAYDNRSLSIGSHGFLVHSSRSGVKWGGESFDYSEPIMYHNIQATGDQFSTYFIEAFHSWAVYKVYEPYILSATNLSSTTFNVINNGDIYAVSQKWSPI